MQQTRFLSTSILLFNLARCLPAGAQAPPPTVRVATIGCVGTPRALTVTTGGAWRLIDLGDRHLLCQGSGSVQWQFTVDRSGRVTAQSMIEGGWTGADSAARPAGTRCRRDAQGFRLEGGVPGQQFAVGAGRRARIYPGAVEVLPVRQRSGSGLRLINEAPLEQYLAGVVSAEGSASFQPEALKALSIAARSYAERNRFRHAPDGELCDTVHCQVYPGVGHVPEKVARAVADSAGVVALSGGEVIDAVYSADCGGRTRNSEDVWPQRSVIPYLRSVEDRPPSGGPDYCAVYRNHALRLRLTPGQVGRLLGLRAALPRRLELHGVERDGSGRVSLLRLSVDVPPGDRVQTSLAREDDSRRQPIVGTAAEETAVGDLHNTGAHTPRPAPDGVPDEVLPCELLQAGADPALPVPTAAAAPNPATAASASPAPAAPERAITLPQIQRLLGDQLRGRLVTVFATTDGGLDLECRGLGHGVGLCQWGAQGMALPPYNRSCEEILRHYYSGISLGPAPARTARLLLEIEGDNRTPRAGVMLRLLPGGLSGTTDERGLWDAPAVPEGTYTLEARQGTETITYYAVRVTAVKGAGARLTLLWHQAADKVARGRIGASGG